MLRSLALLALTTAPALALASALGGAAGIDWTATFEGALERAAAEERVVFIAVNMDGERANERMVDKVYGDRDIQRLASETVNLIASADRHRKSGKCPRFGCADCDEHRFVDIAVREQVLKPSATGAVIAPQHARDARVCASRASRARAIGPAYRQRVPDPRSTQIDCS